MATLTVIFVLTAQNDKIQIVNTSHNTKYENKPCLLLHFCEFVLKGSFGWTIKYKQFDKKKIICVMVLLRRKAERKAVMVEPEQ